MNEHHHCPLWLQYILDYHGAAVSFTYFICTLEDSHQMGEGIPCQKHKDLWGKCLGPSC